MALRLEKQQQQDKKVCYLNRNIDKMREMFSLLIYGIVLEK